MNDNDFRYGSGDSNTYRATSNLNTAIENPQVNINNAMGVNLQNIEENSKYGLNNSYDVSNSYDASQSFVNEPFAIVDDKIVSNVSNLGDISDSNVQNFSEQPQFINSNISNSNVSVEDSNLTTKDSGFNYEPTLIQKKKPNKDGLVISKELKMLVLIVFVLLVFVFVVPYIYDFFKELDLVITDG